VNSFGYGGTNAHVILEAPEDYMTSNFHLHYHKVTSPKSDSKRGLKSTTTTSLNSHEKRRLFVLTHDNEGGISRLAADLKRYLQQTSSSDNNILDSLAYTLLCRRSKLSFRVAVSATSTQDLLESLHTIVKGSTRPQKALETPKVCFVFTGETFGRINNCVANQN